MIKIYVNKNSIGDGYYISKIGNGFVNFEIKNTRIRGCVQEITDDLYALFCDYEVIKEFEPNRPSEDHLKTARAIVDMAGRLNGLTNKILMVKTMREISGLGIKESKDAIEYAMIYPV